MFNKEVLNNNVRIISSPVAGAQSVTMMVLVKVGSRNEHDAVWGGAHYIEHLMFKGTEKRPNTLILSKELDAMGAEFNAFTGKEYTVYYVKSNKKHFKQVCDILFDMLHNSVFDAEEMEREKKVIVEEIKMYYENPLMHIDDVYESLIYSDNRLGLDIAGSRESVLDMKRDDVIAFRDSAYTSDNMIVSLAGGVDDEVLNTTKEYFNSYKKNKPNTVAFENFDHAQEGPRVKIDYRDTEQVQLMMGFHALPYGHDDMPILKLLSIILGGSMSSRMFIEIRERLGLCYSVAAYMDAYQDTGSLRVRAGLDKNRIDEALRAINKELYKIAEESVTDEELQRAKDFMDGKTTLKLEDTFEWARWYGMQELMGTELKTPEEKLQRLSEVTAADIQRVAQDIIDFNRVNLAIIGPFKDEQHFIDILSEKN